LNTSKATDGIGAKLIKMKDERTEPIYILYKNSLEESVFSQQLEAGKCNANI
jgi:hypothetical protein